MDPIEQILDLYIKIKWHRGQYNIAGICDKFQISHPTILKKTNGTTLEYVFYGNVNNFKVS